MFWVTSKSWHYEFLCASCPWSIPSCAGSCVWLSSSVQRLRSSTRGTFRDRCNLSSGSLWWSAQPLCEVIPSYFMKWFHVFCFIAASLFLFFMSFPFLGFLYIYIYYTISSSRFISVWNHHFLSCFCQLWIFACSSLYFSTSHSESRCRRLLMSSLREDGIW